MMHSQLKKPASSNDVDLLTRQNPINVMWGGLLQGLVMGLHGTFGDWKDLAWLEKSQHSIHRHASRDISWLAEGQVK